MTVIPLSPSHHVQALVVDPQLTATEKAEFLLMRLGSVDLFGDGAKLRQKLMYVATQLGVLPADNALKGCAKEWQAGAEQGLFGHVDPIKETILTIGMMDALAVKYGLPLPDFNREIFEMTIARPMNMPRRRQLFLVKRQDTCTP